jgi:hypothetical protein
VRNEDSLKKCPYPIVQATPGAVAARKRLGESGPTRRNQSSGSTAGTIRRHRDRWI